MTDKIMKNKDIFKAINYRSMPNSNTVYGQISFFSALYEYLNTYQLRYHLKLHLEPVEPGYIAFKTSRDCMDPIDIDLLNGSGDGKVKQKFIDFVEHDDGSPIEFDDSDLPF